MVNCQHCSKTHKNGEYSYHLNRFFLRVFDENPETRDWRSDLFTLSSPTGCELFFYGTETQPALQLRQAAQVKTWFDYGHYQYHEMGVTSDPAVDPIPVDDYIIYAPGGHAQQTDVEAGQERSVCCLSFPFYPKIQSTENPALV